MYSPDDQGEYVPKAGVSSFSVQGLSNALTALDIEVTMADHPGYLHPPVFLWNVGMVLYVLKNDPTLRDLEHIQVDGPRMAYLFFFNKQGHQELTYEAAQAIRAHVGEAFAEWISCSAHFTVNPLPLVEGWCMQLWHLNGTSIGHRWSIKATWFSTWPPVNQIPPSISGGVPLLLLLGLPQWRTLGVDGPQRHPLPNHGEGLPRPNKQRRALETHLHPLQTKEGQIQMGTP